MTTQNKQSALVIGAGLAGLTAAYRLSQQGFQVTLCDRSPKLGGRTYNFNDKITGLEIDNGQHLMIGAYHQTLELLEELGTSHLLHWQNPMTVPLFGENKIRHDFHYRAKSRILSAAKALWNFKGLSLKDKLSLGTLLFDLKRPHTEITAYDWLKKHGQSESAIKNFWEILIYATLNDDPKVTSADGLQAVLLKSFFSKAKDGLLIFPKVGLSKLFVEPILEKLQNQGQTLCPKKAVKELHIQNNRCHAVTFSDGTQSSYDLVVSAVPFQNVLKLFSDKTLSQFPQLHPLQNWVGSPILSVNFIFDQPILEGTFWGSAETAVHWFFNRNDYVDVPKPYQHIVGVISGGYKWLDASKDELVAQALKDLRTIFPHKTIPNPIHSLVNKERFATLSNRVGVSRERPKQKLLDNLYIVGDWTKTGLPGTIESAVVSGNAILHQLEVFQSTL